MNFLENILERLAQEPNRAVLREVRGKNFTTGIDLVGMVSEVPALTERGIEGNKRFKFVKDILRLQESITALDRCRKPVIAAVHGWCIGAGVDMISACDIRLASMDAQFSVREARVAIVADVGTLQRLPRIIGEGYTKELTYTAKDIAAARAKEIGLLNEVFTDKEALYAGARQMAQEICDSSPLAVMAAKEVIGYCRDKSVADGLDYVANRSANILPSDDFYEAIAAFSQRRKPNFTGK